MPKDLFNSYTNDIEVPKEDLIRAIDTGIERGEKFLKTNKRTSILKRTSFLTSAAATLLLASGFVFSPVTNVLAQVPLIGGIYEKYQMPIGQELASEQLITELHETVENNGVKMTVTSIFYDGQYIGLTFKATGDHLEDTIGGDRVGAPESGFTYEMFDRTDTSGWGGSMGSLTKEGDSYVGAMLLENMNPTVDISSLPITFTHIAGVRGEWSFNLAVEKLPSKHYTLEQTVASVDGKYEIKFHSINVAKTNAILSYTILKTARIEGETFNDLNVFDSNGDKLSLNSLSDSQSIFEIHNENSVDFFIVEPIFKIGDEEIHLETLRVNLN